MAGYSGGARMMNRLNVMALFCQDIREEKADTRTLVGLLPDQVILNLKNSQPGLEDGCKILPKLCVFVRINFDLDFELDEPEIWLVAPDGERIFLGPMPYKVVQQARTEAAEKGSPLAGVVSCAVMLGYQVTHLGTLRLEVKINGTFHLAGAINFSESEVLDPSPATTSSPTF